MNLQDTIGPVIFFDGECNLCNSSVQFVIRHDKKQQFFFAPLQSNIGNDALKGFQGKLSDSFVLLYNGRYYIKSTAALMVCRLLGGLWSTVYYTGIIFPQFVRDAVYDIIARNRYKWFGRLNECMVPTPELKKRFLS